jgi:hypothetical protein
MIKALKCYVSLPAGRYVVLLLILIKAKMEILPYPRQEDWVIE